MAALIVVEKVCAALLFACVNFIIPFGFDWIKYVLLSLPGLLVIDILYGRVILYSAAGALLNVSKTKSVYLEAVIYFTSLIFSLGIVILVTGQVEVLLIYGKTPSNCFAYY